MAHLEELVKTTDAELKSANAARESLTKVQEGLARELNELFDSLQKT